MPLTNPRGISPPVLKRASEAGKRGVSTPQFFQVGAKDTQNTCIISERVVFWDEDTASERHPSPMDFFPRTSARGVWGGRLA